MFVFDKFSYPFFVYQLLMSHVFVDINECERDPCSNNPRRVCVNNIGSYTCICDNGYSEINEMCEGRWLIRIVCRTV